MDFEIRKIENYSEKYQNLLETFTRHINRFQTFLHIETYNNMNATTKAPLGLTSLGLRQYITN
jgi:hypothetical protein